MPLFQLRSLLPAAALVGAIGCASRQTARSCPPADVPEAWVQSAPVYRACHVDRPAEIDRSFTPQLVFQPIRPLPCYTAVVEFVVDTTGAPELSTIRVVRATGEFGPLVAGIVPQLRYRPATRQGTPVRQLTEFRTAYTFTVRVQGPSAPTGSTRTAPCVP